MYCYQFNNNKVQSHGLQSNIQKFQNHFEVHTKLNTQKFQF